MGQDWWPSFIPALGPGLFQLNGMHRAWGQTGPGPGVQGSILGPRFLPRSPRQVPAPRRGSAALSVAPQEQDWNPAAVRRQLLSQDRLCSRAFPCTESGRPVTGVMVVTVRESPPQTPSQPHPEPAGTAARDTGGPSVNVESGFGGICV